MNGAIGQLLPAAVGVAVSPLPIVATVLLPITGAKPIGDGIGG